MKQEVTSGSMSLQHWAAALAVSECASHGRRLVMSVQQSDDLVIEAGFATWTQGIRNIVNINPGHYNQYKLCFISIRLWMSIYFV